ncbi:MAG TPA: hypothetical protein EYH50_04550 [Pyrodictium delaneyi]|uniref:Phosphate-starvation-inducible E n=1 Tax=Pyrodictium delaneyi TaxID=1273541 RepID=A0A833A2E0_9CREN|nr:hypothetical protein [Pyrodictium delaneyi]
MASSDAREHHFQERLLARVAAGVYEAFEIVALLALSMATAMAIIDFFKALIEHGFIYTEVVEKVLLIFVFIDLTRTIVGSIVEGRFRMDILFEAITIAIARDLIGFLAFIGQQFNPVKAIVLTGMLATSVVLWIFARRIEIREPGPRIGLYGHAKRKKAEQAKP